MRYISIVSAVFLSLLSCKEVLTSASEANVPTEFRQYFDLANRVRVFAIQNFHDYTRWGNFGEGPELLTNWFNNRNDPSSAAQIESQLVEYAQSRNVRMVDALFEYFGREILTNFRYQQILELSIRHQKRVDKLVQEQEKVSLQIGLELKRLEYLASIRSLLFSKMYSAVSSSTCTFLHAKSPQATGSEISRLVGSLLNPETDDMHQIDSAFRTAMQYIENSHRTNPSVFACLRNSNWLSVLDPKPLERRIQILKSFSHQIEWELSEL